MTPTGFTAMVALVSGAVMAVPQPPVNCQASDYRTGAEFDLSNLQNLVATAPDGQTTTTYLVHPCGKKPTKTFDDECEAPYACQYGDKKVRLATQVYRDMLQPLVTDGTVPQGARLVMRKGDKCHDEQERSLTVHYYCEPDGDERVEINEAFHCAYDMFVYSKQACPSLPSPAKSSPNPCTFTSKDGKKYDLSPLKKLVGNHVVTERDLYDPKEADVSDEYEFIINICQDININKAYAHDSALRNCHKDGDFPGICQVYYDDAEPFKPHYRLLWQTLQGATKEYAPLSMENDVLTLKYGRGTAYSSGALRNSEIQFHCLAGSGAGRPEFEREDIEKGTYYFTWTTEYACADRKETSGGMSGGTIFALITFVIIPSTLLLYCLVGMLCNRQSGKSGMDMVPHIEILRNMFSCCSSSGASNGLSIRADGETGQSLMDDDDYN